MKAFNAWTWGAYGILFKARKRKHAKKSEENRPINDQKTKKLIGKGYAYTKFRIENFGTRIKAIYGGFIIFYIQYISPSNQ